MQTQSPGATFSSFANVPKSHFNEYWMAEKKEKGGENRQAF